MRLFQPRNCPQESTRRLSPAERHGALPPIASGDDRQRDQSGQSALDDHRRRVQPRKPIQFFEALVADAGRKAFLILDNLADHHCKPVKQRLIERGELMDVFYLPSDSPE